MAFSKQTYSEQVAAYIKERILLGELAPGDQVKEVVLAERLGISRAPIREALHILIREGLICSEPQRGKFIRALSGKEVRDSYFIGGVLEGAAVAATVGDFDENDIRSFRELAARMRRQSENAANILELSDLDNDFHDLLLSRCDNLQLIDLARRSCLNISKFLFYNHWSALYRPDEFCDRHDALIDALEKRDPAAMERAIRDHYAETGERMSRFGY